MGSVHSPALYDSASASNEGTLMNTLTQTGHLIIGALAIGATTTLAVLHDITGTSAVELIVAIAGVSLGIGAATNSTPV